MRRHGRPISGAEYFKLKWGPAPRRLLPVRQQLLEEGNARLVDEVYQGLVQERLVPMREPDVSLFSPDELAVVDQVVGELYGMSRDGCQSDVSQRGRVADGRGARNHPLRGGFPPATSHHRRRAPTRRCPGRPPSRLIQPVPRRVVRSEGFVERAQALYPPGGSSDGRPSFDMVMYACMGTDGAVELLDVVVDDDYFNLIADDRTD